MFNFKIFLFHFTLLYFSLLTFYILTDKSLKSLVESLRNELKNRTGDVRAFLKDDGYELKTINIKLLNEIETLKNQKTELTRMVQAMNLQSNGNEAIAELQGLFFSKKKSIYS